MSIPRTRFSSSSSSSSSSNEPIERSDGRGSQFKRRNSETHESPVEREVKKQRLEVFRLDIPPVERPRTDPFPQLQPGTLKIADIPRIRAAGNVRVVLDALQSEDLTSHSDMPFRLIEQLFKVAREDTALLGQIVKRLLMLAKTTHDLRCVLTAFVELAQHLPSASRQELVRLVETIADERSMEAPATLSGTFELYLKRLKSVASSTACTDIQKSAMPEKDNGIADFIEAPELPPGTLVIPLELPAQPEMEPDEIISINPGYSWDHAWTRRILELPVPEVNALSVETTRTLKASATPMARLALLNREYNQQYGGKLSCLRWSFQLTLERLKLNRDPAVRLQFNESVQMLVDLDVYESNLAQAPSHHTLALMVAGWQNLSRLYRELHNRAKNRAGAPRHMSLAQLPADGLLAAYLMLDKNGAEFEAMVRVVLNTSNIYGAEAQAQVYADLCAFFFQPERNRCADLEQQLDALGTQASCLQLDKLARYKAVAGLFYVDPPHPIEPAAIGSLIGMLPSHDQPWNVFSLVAMQLLSDLHRQHLLASEQVEVLVSRTTALVRHVLSLAVPGNPDDEIEHTHPFQAVYFVCEAALVESFMQLSLLEQARFLKSCPLDHVEDFIERLAKAPSSPAENIALIDAILRLEALPSHVSFPLGIWRRQLRKIVVW